MRPYIKRYLLHLWQYEFCLHDSVIGVCRCVWTCWRREPSSNLWWMKSTYTIACPNYYREILCLLSNTNLNRNNYFIDKYSSKKGKSIDSNNWSVGLKPCQLREFWSFGKCIGETRNYPCRGYTVRSYWCHSCRCLDQPLFGCSRTCFFCDCILN